MRLLLQLILGLLGAPCAITVVLFLRMLALNLLQTTDDPSEFFLAIVLPVVGVFGIFYGVFLGATLHDWLRPHKKDAVVRFSMRHLLVVMTLVAVLLGLFAFALR